MAAGAATTCVSGHRAHDLSRQLVHIWVEVAAGFGHVRRAQLLDAGGGKAKVAGAARHPEMVNVAAITRPTRRHFRM